jgi:hypothetical protein
MATLPAGGSSYGNISTAPGRQDEDELKNRTHTTANVSGGVTTTTTVPATFATLATTVAANGTVAACKTAIRTVRRTDRIPSSNNANKTGRVTRVDTVQGRILTVGTLVGGSNYVTGVYSAVALTGGTGTGATANITVNNAGGIIALDTLVGGTLYGNGTYTAVPLTGGTGTGAQATIVVASGIVTTVTLTASGTGYTDNNVLSASDANLGNLGTGSGFTISVNGTKGAVSAVSLVAGGAAYDVGEVLSAAAANIGGTGSGFSVTVATTSGPINA